MALILRLAGEEVLAAFRSGDEERLAVAELGQVLPSPSADFDPLPYLTAQQWTATTTRPKNPHQYVLLVRFIEPGDGWRHWALPNPNATILNRRPATEGEPEQGSSSA